MTKITKATSSQWKAVEELRLRTIAGQTAQIDKKRVRQSVCNMWQNLGQKDPIVFVADSPLAACFADSILTNKSNANLRDDLNANLYDNLHDDLYAHLYANFHEQLHADLNANLYDNLHDQLHEHLYAHLYANFHEQLHADLHDDLYDDLYDDLREQLREHLYASLREQLRVDLHNQIRDQLKYTKIFWRIWAVRCEAAIIMGVDFATEAVSRFLEWCLCVPFCIPRRGFVCTSANPTQIHWKGELLHNDDGLAVEFADGWGVYAIEGIQLDEQIVMRPNSQTIKQIDEEENADIKAIRTERFGWIRYIKESGARCVDARHNDIEGTDEALYALNDGSKRLVAVCPTGWVHAMGVPAEISACESAQQWLAGPNTFRNLTRT